MMYVLLFVFFLSLVKFIFLFFVCHCMYGEIKICIIIQVVYSIQVRSVGSILCLKYDKLQLISYSSSTT